MTLPIFELYGWNTPNGQKITIALEEVGANYHYHPVDITNGEQHRDSFRLISPDGKIPALIHRSAVTTNNGFSANELSAGNKHATNDRAKSNHEDGTTITLFESGAILLYLANLFPAINGRTEQEKSQVMSWTFWQVGQLGPLAGQFGRFHNATPANPAAVEHFEQLVWRCLGVLEKRLSESAYLAAEHFTVADIASFTWVASEQSYLQKFNLKWSDECPAIARWANAISQRASVQKQMTGTGTV